MDRLKLSTPRYSGFRVDAAAGLLMNSGPGRCRCCAASTPHLLALFKNERRWLSSSTGSLPHGSWFAIRCRRRTVPVRVYQSKPADISLHGVWSFDGRAARVRTGFGAGNSDGMPK